jgi:flagellar protein FlaG
MEIQRTPSGAANVTEGAVRKPAAKEQQKTVPEPAEAPLKAPTRQELRAIQAEVAERLSAYLKESGRALEFRVDEGADATVTTIRRADTGEVVRQFPTEQALAWMRRMNAQSGTFFDALT